MDTETQTAHYHAKVRAQIRARKAQFNDSELANSSARTGLREARAARARARSADRWADDEAKADQQRRAGRLELVIGGQHEPASSLAS